MRRGRSVVLWGVNRSGAEYSCVPHGSPTSTPTGVFDAVKEAMRKVLLPGEREVLAHAAVAMLRLADEGEGSLSAKRRELG